MEITEVKVRLMEDKTERLRAFCTVTLDREFVVRDIKIIDGAKGLFIAMPSRKVTDHCPKCGGKNHLRAKFCNDCGARLPGVRSPDSTEGSSKLHVDVAHPINSDCRARFQKAILEAYAREEEHAKKPGYVSPSAADVQEPQAAPEPPAEEPEIGKAEGPIQPEESEEPEPSPSEPANEQSFGEGLR